MCYHFTTPLRRPRAPHGFASAQAQKLVAFGASSSLDRIRFAGMRSNPQGYVFAGSSFRLRPALPGPRRGNGGEKLAGKDKRDWDISQSRPFMGWVKGLEPSTPGTTIRCSNQLSYTHHRENGTPEGTRTPGLLLRRQLLYPTELLAHMQQNLQLFTAGAGEGNRTLVSSLEGWCSTIELHPQAQKG